VIRQLALAHCDSGRGGDGCGTLRMPSTTILNQAAGSQPRRRSFESACTESLAGSAANELPLLVASLDPVVARAGVVRVPAGASVDPVRAAASRQTVVALVAQQTIAARATHDAIVAALAAHAVGASQREDQVTEIADVTGVSALTVRQAIPQLTLTWAEPG
jgi:hypothetical protein